PVPAAPRALAVGIWSAVSGAAVSVGPVVGGAVTDGLDWHWIFWINIPVGVIAIPFALMTLPESRGKDAGLDLVGLALSTGGVFALVWGIVKAGEDGWDTTKAHVA